VCVRVDSRGSGRSPGHIDIWSPRQARDLYNCIEWAGFNPEQRQSGLNGISYYAQNQWQVACLHPPHLTAMCIWEGAADFTVTYPSRRDLYHLARRLVRIADQTCAAWHGQTRFPQPVTGELVSGPETLTNEELGNNRSEFGQESFSPFP